MAFDSVDPESARTGASVGATTRESNFNSRRFGGVRHPPEADIESIRELLHGYGPGNILKELIQNAEDAGASRMDMLYVPADPAASISLLKNRGLLVANNGTFTEDHRDAITQISLGTKGTEDRAIGRFGKGLKSVFAWCEAFYIIARTDPKLGWPEPRISDFFNPWCGWRHSDWDVEFESHSDILTGKVEQYLDSLYPAGQAWLALWFPLRTQVQANNESAEYEWISSSFPGDDTKFYNTLGLQLRALAPSLVSLRNLERIAVIDRNIHPHDSLIFDFPPQSQRIPAPDAAPGAVISVDGRMSIHTVGGRDAFYQYCGLAGRLRDEEIAHLKAARDWPRVVQRTRGQTSVNLPVKGEPHFATLITWNSVSELELSGSLDVRWCVFFPVGKQPLDKLPVNLPSIRHRITINLHGFFFLDSERLRIDGLDERFNDKNTISTGRSLEWNRIVATDGTLAHLPEALASFAEQATFTNVHCRELTKAIRHTSLWSAFQEAICQRNTWRPRWRTGAEAWECISAEAPVFFVPHTSASRAVLACIPMLAMISEQCTLVAGDEDGSLPGIYRNKASLWPEELALQLLQDVQLGPGGDDAAAAWLNSFLNYLYEQGVLTEAIRGRIADLPLLPARDGRTNTPLRLSACDWVASIQSGRLFAPDTQPRGWLALLRAALPSWSYLLATSGGVPQWFTGSCPPVCNGTAAAEIVLSQTDLGSFVYRQQLVQAFASTSHRDFAERLALRFLLHADSTHARENTKLLFMPSTQPGQNIWGRLIEQLLTHDVGAESWRLLHD